jgi:hypothetical protein|tara:strand:+ start:940 stop:1566 length:627 start_codon:yes stop_codon:yes gene_type:complete
MSRKIYFVTMVQPSVGAPEGFEERYDAYWNAVDQQVSLLETKSERVARIFVEGVLGEGDEAMLLVQQSNPGAYKVLRERVSTGTVFEMFEDTDLFGKVVDWGRCLHIGLINGEVADEIQTKYDEASEKRRTHFQKRLEEGILESESALVFGDDQNIKLPEGTEKFLISPPERDELERWVQQTNRSIEEQMAQNDNWADSDKVTTPPGV